jgi:hypothetical protein
MWTQSLRVPGDITWPTRPGFTVGRAFAPARSVRSYSRRAARKVGRSPSFRGHNRSEGSSRLPSSIWSRSCSGLSFGETNAMTRIVYGFVGVSGVYVAARAGAAGVPLPSTGCSPKGPRSRNANGPREVSRLPGSVRVRTFRTERLGGEHACRTGIC